MLSTPSSASLVAAPRRLGLWNQCLRWVTALALGLMGLLLTFWLIVHWSVLPHVAQWKPWIERHASEQLGQTVRIGDIRMASRSWVPSLELSDVDLIDGQGRTALHLSRVQAVLSAQGLLGMELRFAQLHVEGVQLDIRRDAKGRIRVAGLDAHFGDAEVADGRTADWLFAQHEIVIRHGTVRWTDELREAPPLELTEVDLVMRNGLLRHQLRLDATPTSAWGQRFHLIGQFSHRFLERRGDWRNWSGTLHADLPKADVGELRQYVNLPFELKGGRGAARLWLDTERGEWRGATADLALADVNVRLASHLEPLALSALTGRFTANRRAQDVGIAATRLALTTGDGVVWPAGDVKLDWTQTQFVAEGSPHQPVTGGRFRADRLDLGVMAGLAARLPLGRALEGTLKRLKPSGVVHGLNLQWTGSPDAPVTWRADGRLNDFELPPLPAAQAGTIGRPGVKGAQVEFVASETGGKASLAVRQGSLDFPGVFESPTIALNDLQSQLQWRVTPQPQGRPAIELQVVRATFANDDLHGDLHGHWRTGKQAQFGPEGYFPGEIDLEGNITTDKVERVTAYLPLGIAAHVRRYVGRALKAGRLDEGSFVIKGDVWRFPFNHGQPGTLRLAGRLSEGQFDYLPSVAAGEVEAPWTSPWPGFSQISGDFLLDRSSLSLDKAQARLWGVQLRDVDVRIEELGPQAALKLRGEGRGPLADILRYVDVTPIGQWLGGALRPVAALGAGDFKLELGLPLLQPQQTTVKGSLQLAGNDVQMRPELPVLVGTRGRVDFTHQSVQIVNATASALGGELAFEGGTQADRSLRFLAQGVATADGLKRAREFAPLPDVAQALRGQTQWRAQLDFQRGLPEITVTSDLVGMQSDWPAPLGKSAAASLPIRWQTSWQASRQTDRAPSEPATRDEVRLDVGTVAQLRLLREWARDGNERAGASEAPAAPRILAGTIGLNEAAATPEAPGVLAVRGRLARLDADAWKRALETAPTADGPSGMPRLQVAVQVDELTVAARQFSQVDIDARQDAPNTSAWQAQVTATQLAGRLAWKPPQGMADGGLLTARLSRLTMTQAEAVAAQPLGDPSFARPPTVDVQVDEFELRGRKLGRLTLLARPRTTGVTRDWSLDTLNLEFPGGSLTGEGHWTAPRPEGGDGRMAVNLNLNLQDGSRVAAYFGLADAIRGGNGLIQGQLGWAGSPLAPSFNSLEGRFNVALSQGQFLRAEPGGIGRLLGILSLQSLPRRLLLDFRDVFQEGFAFDRVTGDIQVSQGRALTDNLRMGGLQATVLIGGSADLTQETQNLRVLIVPEVNAGAASLAYATINPALGLGTFLAQLLLREPLRAANTREFAVTGPMAQPKVERVERRPGAPLPGQPAEIRAPLSPGSLPPATTEPTPPAAVPLRVKPVTRSAPESARQGGQPTNALDAHG